MLLGTKSEDNRTPIWKIPYHHAPSKTALAHAEEKVWVICNKI